MFIENPGPYVILVERFEPCKDQGSGKILISGNINQNINGSYEYNGLIVLGEPLDDKLSLHIEFFSWENGQLGEYTIKSCEHLLQIIPDFMQGLTKEMGLQSQKCPIPKGNFTFHNWQMNFKLNSLSVASYNKFQLTATGFYENKKVGCYTLFGETVPKHKG